MPEYNTSKEQLILKEYGRNVQKLVNYIRDVKDKETRNRYATTLIELMRQINPSHKESNETNQRLWDDLFIMADFDIDIDSPYPIPDKEVLNRKPKKLEYSNNNIKFRHFGKNLELLIKAATELDNEEEKEAAVIYLGKLMKSFNNTWNKDNIEDETILRNIKILSDNKLDIDIEKVKEQNLFESLYKERSKPPNKSKKQRSSNQRQGNGRYGNNKRRRH